MSENLFPSGHWTGFYAYAPQDKHRMDMHLTFARGKVAGEGNDDIGVFMVRGGYDTGTKECYFTKSYPGSHDVFYRGFREGKGIWGKWELDKLTTGGFHIWPRGEGSGDLEAQTAAESKPVEAIGKEEAVPAGELVKDSKEWQKIMTKVWKALKKAKGSTPNPVLAERQRRRR